MIITLQIRSCPLCHLENAADAAQCHSCGAMFRCARAQVIDIPMKGVMKSAKSEAAKPVEKLKIAAPEKSIIKRCIARFRARKYDISSLHFD